MPSFNKMIEEMKAKEKPLSKIKPYDGKYGKMTTLGLIHSYDETMGDESNIDSDDNAQIRADIYEELNKRNPKATEDWMSGTDMRKAFNV